MRLYSILVLFLLAFGLLSCSSDKNNSGETNSEIAVKLRVYHSDSSDPQKLTSFGNTRLDSEDLLVFYEGTDLFPDLNTEQIFSLQPKSFARVQYESFCTLSSGNLSLQTNGVVQSQSFVSIKNILPRETYLLAEGTVIACDINLTLWNIQGSSLSIPKKLSVNIKKDASLSKENIFSSTSSFATLQNIQMKFSEKALLEKGDNSLLCVAANYTDKIEVDIHLDTPQMISSVWKGLEPELTYKWASSRAWRCGFFRNQELQLEAFSLLTQELLTYSIQKFAVPTFLTVIGGYAATPIQSDPLGDLVLNIQNDNDFAVKFFVHEPLAELDLIVYAKTQWSGYMPVHVVHPIRVSPQYLSGQENLVLPPHSLQQIVLHIDYRKCQYMGYEGPDFIYRFKDGAASEGFIDSDVGSPILLNQEIPAVEVISGKYAPTIPPKDLMPITCQ